MNLGTKILDSRHPVIVYEVIPPPGRAKSANIEAYANCTVELLNSSAVVIDAINIPDIRDEQRDDKPRVSEYVSKADARDFGKRLQKASHRNQELIINRCTVFDPLADQHKWLKETIEKYDIHNLVLVGGESSKIQYPGPSVLELTHVIHERYNSSIFCGGITIPSRSFEGTRMVEKTMKGINFFTSQVIYEPYIVTKVLKDYYQECLQKGIEPKRVFLSFAPISSKKDLEFLRWLGVLLPENVERLLFEADIGIGWRSVKVAKAILASILETMHSEGIKVPLGLNIEHISRHNFELSKELLEELGKIYMNAYETKYKLFGQTRTL
jgi:5,10-methylenetetrahydrofolate reductase